MTHLCESKLGAERWSSRVVPKYKQWESADPEQLGGAIAHVVVNTLEAPHLKPSGIHLRLKRGVDAACYGLATLLDNLPAAESS